jgi:hypothetical protein
MKASNVINLVKLKLESNDQLLVRVWHSTELVLLMKALHVRGRLFMSMLTGQSC